MNAKPIKNILYVENGIGYGGAIICLRHLLSHLDRTRFKPLLVTGRTGPAYQDLTKEVEWLLIADRYFDINDLRRRLEGASLAKRFPTLNKILNQLPARADDICNFLPFFLQLLWTAWRRDIDLIHANNEPLCNRAALLVGKLLHIPTVSHVRGDQNGSRLMRWAFSLPDHFIPVSYWIARSIQDNLQVPDEKITVIYDDVSLEKLDQNADASAFRKCRHIPLDAFAVGLVGLLIPWKGQDLFIDAAKLLRNKIPKLKMLLIGGTPDDFSDFEAALRQRVADENLQDIVMFTGHATDMATVYNSLDVVVSASVSPEPLGIIMIEGIAMGRAVVGPNHGGAAEIAVHNETGLLFSPNDAASLAEQIECLYRDPELRSRLGENARRHAFETFSVEHHADQLQALYDKLLS